MIRWRCMGTTQTTYLGVVRIGTQRAAAGESDVVTGEIRQHEWVGSRPRWTMDSYPSCERVCGRDGSQVAGSLLRWRTDTGGKGTQKRVGTS